MKSYVACFFFTLQTFCLKKKQFNSCSYQQISPTPFSFDILFELPIPLYLFIRPERRAASTLFFFFLVENIRLFAEKKTNKTETIFPIFWPKHNTKNLWKPEEQNIGERRPPHTHKAQPNVNTALMQFIACRLNFFFWLTGHVGQVRSALSSTHHSTVPYWFFTAMKRDKILKKEKWTKIPKPISSLSFHFLAN